MEPGKGVYSLSAILNERAVTDSGNREERYPVADLASDLDLNLDTARKLKLHKGIYSLLGRIIDVKQAAE